MNPKKNFTIVEDFKNWIFIEKPPLTDSQKDVGGWAKEKFGFSGVVHRLDFNTSGVMVVAKNKNGAKLLTEALQAGRFEKTYLAIVLRQMENKSGIIETPILEKNALTRYQTLEIFNNSSLLEIQIETGRMHQIRQHMSEIGHPLLGDHMYGNQATKLLFDRPALHSHKLKIEIENNFYEALSPLSEDLKKLLLKLSGKK